MRFALFALVGLGCGRVGFDELPDATVDVAPAPALACGEIRVIGTATFPTASNDREMSGTATDEGGVVVWNSDDVRLIGVGITLSGSVTFHAFGAELAPAPVRGLGVAAVGSSVLTSAGNDAQTGSTRAQLWSSRLVPQGSSFALPLSAQERDVAFSTPRGDFGVTGLTAGLPGVQRVSSTGAVLNMMTFPTPNLVAETIGIGTNAGALTATTTEATDGCQLRNLRPDLSVFQENGIDITMACDNPRFAYDPVSDRFLFAYARAGLHVMADSAVAFTAQGTRLVDASGTTAVPVWDGAQFWIAYRVGVEPADLVIRPLDLLGLDLAPPVTLTTALAEREYTAFVFAGQVYVVWTEVDRVMRLSRVCR